MRVNALGIELEYEQVDNISNWASTYWVAASDGSLRNRGVELVSRPLFFDSIEAALQEAETVVRSTGAVATARCGLHTHMNMRPYSIGQVWSLAALYALIEPTLYRTYAIDREDSMFAVPLWMNTSQINYLYRDICAIRNLCADQNLPECLSLQSSKYSALNFSSLVSFGTLEMRQPYCSTDFDAIRSWCDFCVRLIEQGTAFEDPEEVLNTYETGSLEELQLIMFGDTYNIDPDIQESAEDAAYLITGTREPHWNEIEWDMPTEETE